MGSMATSCVCEAARGNGIVRATAAAAAAAAAGAAMVVRSSSFSASSSSSSRKCAAAENPLLLEGVLHHVFAFIHSPADRRAVSMVCRAWRAADRDTRRQVYIAFTYSVSPQRFTSTFKNIVSLKLKGKPRAYEFNLLPQNWGGSVAPWVDAIVAAYPCTLRELHLRRMEVSDDDLQRLASGLGDGLESLKLDFCSGFSTQGLLEITRSCRKLKVLYMENSVIRDEGTEWLCHLALHNKFLEALDFQLVEGLEEGLPDVVSYLREIIRICPNLRSLKFSCADGDGLREALSGCTSLKQLGAIISNAEEEEEQEGGYSRFELPRNLSSVSGDIPPALLGPVASRLVKLDLMTCASTTGEAQRELIKCCPNLENLQVRAIIRDEGLRLVADTCKKLQKIRVEEQDDGVFISQEGLKSLARGCTGLRKLAIYVSSISSDALRTVGECCKQLVDFRLVFTEVQAMAGDTSLPLDDGLVALMQGCRQLLRLCVYVPKGVSDAGLSRMAAHAGGLKALLLGAVGDSDQGFLALAAGCVSLERLEMRDCSGFSDAALAAGVRAMPSLKLAWVQGYRDEDPGRLFALQDEDDDVQQQDYQQQQNQQEQQQQQQQKRAGWRVEYYPGEVVQALMYRSLTAGRRPDAPACWTSMPPMR